MAGTVVGCCCAKRGSSESEIAPESCTDYSVFRVSVDQNYRKLRIGAALMDAIENWCKQQGGKRMMLTTGNPIAAIFYRRRGYISSGFMGVSFEKDLK